MTGVWRVLKVLGTRNWFKRCVAPSYKKQGSTTAKKQVAGLFVVQVGRVATVDDVNKERFQFNGPPPFTRSSRQM